MIIDQSEDTEVDDRDWVKMARGKDRGRGFMDEGTKVVRASGFTSAESFL